MIERPTTPVIAMRPSLPYAPPPPYTPKDVPAQREGCVRQLVDNRDCMEVSSVCCSVAVPIGCGFLCAAFCP